MMSGRVELRVLKQQESTSPSNQAYVGALHVLAPQCAVSQLGSRLVANESVTLRTAEIRRSAESATIATTRGVREIFG